MGEFDELIEEFVTESREHIADIEEDLIKIEAEMEKVDPEVINRVFRAAHSIKGSAKFLDLVNIGELAHRLEDVLNLIRAGKIVPTSEISNPLLQAADMLKGMFENVTLSNDMDISEHLIQLQAIIDSAGTAPAAKGMASAASAGVSVLEPFGIDDAAVLKKLETSQIYVLNVKLKGKKLNEFLTELKNLGEIMASQETGKGECAILYATIMEPDMIPVALKIDNDAVTQILPDMLGVKATAPRPEKTAEAVFRPKKKPAPEISGKPPEPEVFEPHEDALEEQMPAKEKIAFNAAAHEKAEEDNTSFITFSLESETYAVPIQTIEEIIGYQDISLLPNVPSFIKGVINLRGELVPILDLRLKFGLESLEYTPLTVFLIVRIETRVMGMVVDNVADVLVIDPDRVQKTPVFSASIPTDFIEGVYKDQQEQMVILVDIPSLIKPEEWVV